MKELRYLGAEILLLILISALIYLSFIHITSTPPGATITTSSQITTKSKTQISGEVEGFLEVGKVYEDLGYPKIFWDPRIPNYTTLPGMKWQTVFTKLNYGSAENLSIENVTITACPKFTREFPPPEDSLIKPVTKLPCFPLVVENVIVVKPGSSGKIYLQIKPINIDSDVILKLQSSRSTWKPRYSE